MTDEWIPVPKPPLGKVRDLNQEAIITEKVVLAIYKHNKENTPVSFSILLQELDISRKELNRSIDRLFDILMIDADWKFVDGQWMRLLHTSHAYDSFIEELDKRNYIRKDLRI